MSNELYHFGVLGMKWGIRRYQNKDGSLTPAGKKRYDRDILDNPLTKEERQNGGRKANTNKYVKEDLERTKRLTDASSNAVNQLRNVNNMSKKHTTKMDLSNMTDKEMREQINRAILERQYNDIFNPQKVSKGKERVDKILDVSGVALAVTSSALGIALAIKELRG